MLENLNICKQIDSLYKKSILNLLAQSGSFDIFNFISNSFIQDLNISEIKIGLNNKFDNPSLNSFDIIRFFDCEIIKLLLNSKLDEYKMPKNTSFLGKHYDDELFISFITLQDRSNQNIGFILLFTQDIDTYKLIQQYNILPFLKQKVQQCIT